MADPAAGRGEIEAILELVHDQAKSYLAELDEAPVGTGDADAAAARFEASLPQEGKGGLETVTTLLQDGLDASIASSGPRFFHFIVGGATPAALGADWVTSLLDQNPGLWVASPLGGQLDAVALGWLRELFELPPQWGGVLTSGATMANYVGLAAARRWWAQRHGHDVDRAGFEGLPPVPVFASGLVHPSIGKALGMLGIGRENLQKITTGDADTLDLGKLDSSLSALDGAPAILCASAGEVNAGRFDPISDMADLAEKHGAWLHVDGAFGLFAAVSPRTSKLLSGIERAHSVISDGHKWLNIPYDCGFAFLRDPSILPDVFASGAPYLSGLDDPRPNFAFLGPESSQRARGITVWATLRAYGRNGYRAMIERHLDLAQQLARRVDEAPELERLADVPLNIVCFRVRRPGLNDEELDDLNTRLGAAVIDDGRVYFGTTVFQGRVAFRPAIVNWRTRPKDIDLLVDVVLELARKVS